MCAGCSIAVTIRQANLYLKKELSKCGCANESRYILSAVTGMDWAKLLSRPDEEISELTLKNIQYFVEMRLNAYPLQYILGEWEFMGLNFAVRPGVLIPRDDSEVLLLAAKDFAKKNSCRTALDLCCGTGCIGIALAKLSGLDLTFVDISDDAIDLTRQNIARHGIKARVFKGDLFSAFGAQNMEKFDIIVSNPPYIRHDEIPSLDKTVRDYEPHLALDGGADGLDFYRKIASEAKKYLNENGSLLLEIGYDQSADVIKLLADWQDVRIIKDMAGNDRVVCAYF